MRRIRGKPVRTWNPIVVAIVGIALLAGGSLAAFRADDLPIIGGGTTYTADFTESAGLVADDEVRVAGVKVGKVTGVALDHGKAKVTFKVKNTWVGNATTAAIEIKTVLGDKYIALDPLGSARQNPGTRIPVERTTSPYDVTQALEDFGETAGRLDSKKIAQGLEVVAQTMQKTPPGLRTALTGLTALSKTISSRDAALARLLAGTKQISGTFADQNGRLQLLLRDGNLLLGEIQKRRDAIHGLLTGTQALAAQLTYLVQENPQSQMNSTLTALDQVTALLQKNQANLNKALALAGPYTRLLGNPLGNGHWMDAYLCGLVPNNYVSKPTTPDSCMPPKQKGN
jgi:phospholipid/cholesterol/gamma-HCH transport system substrate-binding protein